jgi:hypothetical protein
VDIYESLSCATCGQSYLIDPKTGKRSGANESPTDFLVLLNGRDLISLPRLLEPILGFPKGKG